MNAEVRAGDEPGRPTRRRVLWFASFVLGAALFLLVLAATAADADVDASGSFSTNVPLTSPAFHGIEPRLSLNYSSAGVEGWLGDGWTIQGLSAITRESSDHGLPRWDDSTDGYSLAGEPLVSCRAVPSGASPGCDHPAAGTVGYATHVEHGQRIGFTADGFGGTWRAWHTNGVIDTYTPTMRTARPPPGSGHGVLVWRLTTRTDLNGNTVIYDWSPAKDGQADVLQAVRYSDVEIRFVTEARPDPLTVADGDGLITTSTRLHSVEEYAAGARIRSYVLSYTNPPGPIQRSVLASVQQFGSDGTTALPASTYTMQGSRDANWTPRDPASVPNWTSNWPGLADDPHRWTVVADGGKQGQVALPAPPGVPGEEPDKPNTSVSGDFDRDGRTDIGIISQTGPGSPQFNVTIELSDGAAGGYRGSTVTTNWDWHSSAPVHAFEVLVGDVTGDGRDDLIFVVHGYIAIAQSLGGSLLMLPNPQPLPILRSSVYLADQDGDGKADLLMWGKDPQVCPQTIRVGLAHILVGGRPTFDFSPLGTCFLTYTEGLAEVENPPQVVDLNGDGRADLAAVMPESSVTPSTRIVSAISTGPGSFRTQSFDTGQHWGSQFGPGSQNVEFMLTPHWMDVDGDGRSDLVILRPVVDFPLSATTGVEAIVLGGFGDGTFTPPDVVHTPLRTEEVAIVQGTVSHPRPTTYPTVLVADFNGDGRSDFAVVHGRAVSAVNKHPVIRRILSDFNGSFRDGGTDEHDWSNDCPLSDCFSADEPFAMIGDSNGDGTPDVVTVHAHGTTSDPVTDTHRWAAFDTFLSTPTPTAHDVMTADTNGDGLPDLLAIAATPGGVQVRTARQAATGGYQTPSVTDVPLTDHHLARNRWTTGDFNCDGRTDLINTDPLTRAFTVLLAVNDHDWQEVHWTWPPELSLSIGPGQPMFPADFDGDGCTDLVAPGSSIFLGMGSLPGVTVLYGKTDGTFRPESHLVDSAGTAALSQDPYDWTPTNVSGGAGLALVHVNPTAGRVDTIVPNPQGDWRDVVSQLPQEFTAPGRWQPSAVNADNAADLIRVTVDPQGNLTGQTLVGLGDGHLTAVQAAPSGPVAGGAVVGADTGRWQPESLGGRTSTSLIHVFDRGSDTTVQTLTPVNDGATWVLTPGPSGGQAPGAFVPSSTWQVGNTTGPDRISLSHLFIDGTGALLTVGWDSSAVQPLITSINNGSGAATDVTYQPAVHFTGTATVAGSDCRVPTSVLAANVVTGLTTRVGATSPPADSFAANYTVEDGDTLATIAQSVLKDPNQAPALFTLNQGHPEPDGATLDNPEALKPGWILQLPVADSGTETGPVPGTVTTGPDSSSITYGCPRYSQQLKRFLGWTQTQTTHDAAVTAGSATPATGRPGSIEDVTRSIDTRSGIVQTTQDTITDQPPPGQSTPKPLHRTISTFEPLGDRAPYRDRVSSTTSGDCDGAANCAASTTTVSYDDYGNIEDTVEQAAGSGQSRDTSTNFVHDDVRWLHNRARLVHTSSPSSPDEPYRESLTCYDGDTTVDCRELPPLGAGLPTRTLAWNGTTFQQASTATYDQWGNQLTTTDARGNTTKTTFDPERHLDPISTCQAIETKNQCTSSPEPWDRVANAPTTAIDVNGATTRLGYDLLGRLHVVTRPTGARTVTDYTTDPATGTTSTSTTDAPGIPATTTRTFTDGLQHAYRVEKPGGDGARVSVTSTLYLDATLTGVRTAPHFADQLATQFDTTSYDPLSRPIRVIHADGTSVNTSYSITPDGFDVVTTTDETGHTTTRFYDGWSQLARVDQPSVEHPDAPATTLYAYDFVGDLFAVTDPHHNVVYYERNQLGQKTAEHDPDRGTTTYGYDPAGNLQDVTDARGRTLHYTHDPLNRVDSKTDLATGEVTTWRYDEPGHGASVGRLTTVRDPSGAGCDNDGTSRAVSYDTLGNATSDTRCVTGVTGTFSSDFDALGRMTAITYPDKIHVGYGYDDAGHLATVDGYVTGIQYDADDLPHTIRYANDTLSTDTRNPQRAWLLNQTLTPGMGKTTGPLFDASYTHNGAGLVTSTTSASNGEHESYRYDPLGQLTDVVDTTTGQPMQHLNYNDIGNIITNSKVGDYIYPATRTCTANPDPGNTCAGPHAVTTAGNSTYHYDTAGNTLTTDDAGNKQQLTWNTDGYLEQLVDPTAGTIHNTYDSAGTRVREDTPQGSTIYLAGLTEENPVTAKWTDYIYAGGRLVAAHGPDHTSWYTLDRQNSTGALTDNRGAITAQANYSPWGQTATSTGDVGGIGYTGHRTLTGTDLIDMTARDYNPVLGRMLSPDSIIPNPADPQTLNRYTYVHNDPVNYTDPTGHQECDANCQSETLATYAPMPDDWGDLTEESPYGPSEVIIIDVNSVAASNKAPLTQTPTVDPVTGVNLTESGPLGPGTVEELFTIHTGQDEQLTTARQARAQRALDTTVTTILEPARDVLEALLQELIGPYERTGRQSNAVNNQALQVQSTGPSDGNYPHDHHIFSRAGRPFFEAAGIDIDEHTVTIPRDEHLGNVHPEWNNEWEEFFAKDPFPGKAAIEDQAAIMMERHNLQDLYIHPYGEGTGALNFKR